MPLLRVGEHKWRPKHLARDVRYCSGASPNSNVIAIGRGGARGLEAALESHPSGFQFRSGDESFIDGDSNTRSPHSAATWPAAGKVLHHSVLVSRAACPRHKLGEHIQDPLLCVGE
jgi:hypothetical protein